MPISCKRAPLADARQLVSREHIDDPRGAERSSHHHHTWMLRGHPSDDTRIFDHADVLSEPVRAAIPVALDLIKAALSGVSLPETSFRSQNTPA